MFPDWARRSSSIHWTPVSVARRAAELLVTSAGSRVLDVGAGVGKFCLVGACTTAGVFSGIEQRGHLVRLARKIARTNAVDRAHFIQGDLSDLDWRAFDGFYFYNPFEEHLENTHEPMDKTIEYVPAMHQQHAERAQEKLTTVAAGARVVTFHGLGCDVPPGYTLHLHEPVGGSALELWIKD